MARSTALIALAGSAVLVIAVGAVALRGGDDTPEPDATEAATQPDDGTGDDGTPSPSPTDTPSPSPTSEEPSASETPDDGAASPDGDGTATPTEADGTASEDDATDEPSDDTASEDATDTDTDDDGVALGPTDVGDTPQTGGGSLATLGAAVAAGAVAAGRRRDG